MDNEKILAALKALKDGDLSYRLPEDQTGIAGEIAATFNAHVEHLCDLLGEINRVVIETQEGILGAQCVVKGEAGAWAEVQQNVDNMSGSLTGQLRYFANTLHHLTNKGRPAGRFYNEIKLIGENLRQIVGEG